MNQKPPQPPRPASISLLKREIRYIEIGAGHVYQMSAAEAFRVVHGDVRVHLVVSPGAEPAFGYDVGPGGIVHPEALIDSFELPGILQLVAMEATKLEIIPSKEFRDDRMRMNGRSEGRPVHFRTAEILEILDASLRTLFRISSAHRDAIAVREQERLARRMDIAKARLDQSGNGTAAQGMNPAFKERFARLFAAMFDLEAGDVENLLEETEAFMGKKHGGARTNTEHEFPAAPRAPFEALTGPDGLGGLEPVFEDEEASPPTAASPSDLPPWTAEELSTGVVAKPPGINILPPQGAPMATARTAQIIFPPAPTPLPDPFTPDSDFEGPDRPSILPPPPTAQAAFPSERAGRSTTRDIGSLPFEGTDHGPGRTTMAGLDPTSSEWERSGRAAPPGSGSPPPPKPGSGTLSGLGVHRPPSKTATIVGMGTPPPSGTPGPSSPRPSTKRRGLPLRHLGDDPALRGFFFEKQKPRPSARPRRS